MSSSQDGTGVVAVDPWLEPYSDPLRRRFKAFQKWMDTLNQHEGGIGKFSQGYKRMGFNVTSDGDVNYREWAPNATSVHLIGDFSFHRS
jgi:1,4-alpha-glucan branching enzyme